MNWKYAISRNRHRSGYDKCLLVIHPDGPIVARKYLPNCALEASKRIAESVNYWNSKPVITKTTDARDKCEDILL